MSGSDEAMTYAAPIATVDVALFTLRADGLHVGLLRREQPPYAGELALPGGFVHVDEDVDAADTARRILRDKAGATSPYLEQLATFSGRVRDPRGWSLSVAYYALVPEGGLAASALEWAPADRPPRLPFDHDGIVGAARERIRGKASYSTLPAYLLPLHFTLSELQGVYELAMGTRLDKVSFRRKVEEQGLVEPVPGERRGGAHRPAQLYRLTDRTLRVFERTI